MKIKKILESFTSGFRSSFQNDTTNANQSPPLTSGVNLPIPSSQLSVNEIQKNESLSPIRKYNFSEIKKLSNIELRLITPDNLVDNLNPLEKKEIAEYISSKLKTRVDFSIEDISKNEDKFPFIRPLIVKQNKKSTKNKTAPILQSPDSISSKEYPITSEKDSKVNYYSNKANNQSKALTAFVSYAASPESLQVFFNKQKVTVFINGLSHDDEKSVDALLCKEFLNNNLKKKTVYLEKLQDLNETTILANVFFDKNKTINIAVVAEKNGFHSSRPESVSENDLVIPDRKIIPKYTNKKDINLADYSDIKFQNKELTPFESCFHKHKHIINKENQIGLLVDHGEAPYLFDKNNGKSYFVKIKQLDKEIFLWGQNLPKALSDSNTILGDFIHLNKYVEENPKTKRKYNLWLINNIEKGLDISLQEQFIKEHPEYNQSKTNSNHLNTNDTSNSSSESDDVNIQLRERINNNQDFTPDPNEKHVEIVGNLDALFDEDNPFLHLDMDEHKSKPRI